MADVPYLLEKAKLAALDAGKAIMHIYGHGQFALHEKEDRSPLTAADKRSHSIIIEHLGHTGYPILSEEGGIIDFEERKHWEYFWLIDPLDGTKEFISRNGEFTVNIAFVRDNSPVAGRIYAPCTDTLYSGAKETGIYKNEKGNITRFTPLSERLQFKELLQKQPVRFIASRSHISAETKTFINQFTNVNLTSLGSSLKFMMLLENKGDIYPRFGTTMEWDTAAAHAILNASNRGVYQVDLRTELVYNKPDLKNPSFIAF